jgi:hypothetical protein
MGHESSEWTGEEPVRKLTRDQGYRNVLPVAFGVGMGLIARNATREALGLWSIIVCVLVAAVAAQVATYFVSAWQRRHNPA